MTPDGRYWDRATETMDPADREKVVLAKLREQVAYCSKASAFYRERWEAAGFDPDTLATLADIRRIPLLKKADLRAEQAAYPPFGRHLCVARSEVARIHGTSGTTGRPTAFAISHADWDRIAAAHARILWGTGIRPGDTASITSP